MPYKDKEKYKQYQKEYRRLHKDKRSTKYYEKNPYKRLLHGAKKRAKKKGIPFSITLNDIDTQLKICPILKIPLFFTTSQGNGGRSNTPSIDRVDPQKGYVPGNVRIISHAANSWKKNFTKEQVESLLKYLS